MPRRRSLERYLTVKAAAAFLGVRAVTLRNRDRAGKRGPHRHPMNRDRLCHRAELEAIRCGAAREDQEDE